MDESEAYDHGQYQTYEDAVIAAKAIGDEFFKYNWKSGQTPDYLVGLYCLQRRPVILPNEPGKHERL